MYSDSDSSYSCSDSDYSESDSDYDNKISPPSPNLQNFLSEIPYELSERQILLDTLLKEFYKLSEEYIHTMVQTDEQDEQRQAWDYIYSRQLTDIRKAMVFINHLINDA